MKSSRAIFIRSQCRRRRGFSLVELVLSLTVMMILSAVAIPTLMRAYRSYVLGDASSRFAGIVKLARFDAIRMNRNISFHVKKIDPNWIIWVDRDGNNVADPTEPQMLITGIVKPLAVGSPAITPIVTAFGATPTVLGSDDSATGYDARGSITPSGLFIFFLGNPDIPDFGERAIVLLPSGIVQVWSSSSGSWRRLG